MRRTLAVSLFALVCTTEAYAQAVVGSGAITGIVLDKYGDGIPETTVSLTNKGTGLKRTMLTSDNGIFTMPALPPAAAYDLKVTRRGYADWELASFDLSVGETVNFKIHLYADRPSTPDDALRSIAPVQDTKTSVTALVTDDQLFALPTPVRQVDPLVLLAPAVVESPEGVLAFHGQWARNVFLLDGVSITNNYFLYHPDVAPFVAQDAVAQMQVVPAAAPVDFAHTMGGMVNAISKSGTNGLHASAYDYFSQNSWDSADFFGNGFIPTGRQNHGGVSFGLPISTDTLFLFGNVERVNNSSQGLNRILNPLLTTPDGNTVLASSCTATAAQCQQAANFINQQLNVKVPQSQITTSGFARMDFRPNEHNAFTLAGSILSGRGVNMLDNSTVSTNGGMIASNANVGNSTRFATFGWTHVIGESMVNDFHGEWLRDTMTTATNSSLLPAGSSTCIPCGTGPLAINVDGTALGANPAVPFNMREQRYAAADSFTFTLGSHSVRVGADAWRREDTMDQLWAQYGMYNYDSLTAFAQDFSSNVRALKNYATFDQTFGASVLDTTDWLLSAYAEDTWKVRPGFTVNAGVRWDKARLPKPTEPNSTNYLSEFIPSPNTDAQPRFGLAYMLDNRTVVRIGGGSYYDPFPGQLVHDLFNGGAVSQTSYELTPADTGTVVFPTVLPSSAVNTLNTALQGQFFAAERFRNPYSLQGTAAIERRLNRYASLALTYVQSRGVRMWTAWDLKIVGNTSTSETYNINNAQGATVSTFTTRVWNGATAGHNYEVDNEGGSKYHAGTAQLRTAPLFGLSLQAAYTWSHAIDDVSGPRVQNTIVPSTYYPTSYVGDNGPSLFDQRNHAVVNFTWEPVVSKRNDAVSRFLLNGWMFSGIGTYSASMYVTPLVEVQGQQFTVTNTTNTKITMDFPNTLNGSGGWSRVPFENVNSLPLGSWLNIDVQASKTVPFTPRLRGQFTVQAFNATDHRNISAVNTIAYTATLGTLTPVTGLGTPIASNGYPFGTTARHLQVAFRLSW
jgi:hypothetical protein